MTSVLRPVHNIAYIVLLLDVKTLNQLNNNFFSTVPEISAEVVQSDSKTTEPTPRQRSRSTRDSSTRVSFKGGVLALSTINSTSARLTSTITWDLDAGPCEPDRCTPGTSTRAWRSRLIAQSGSPGIFGHWSLDTATHHGNYSQLDFTDYFNAHAQSRVLEVNSAGGWVLERAELDLLIPPDFQRLTVVLDGDAWTPQLDSRWCVHQTPGCPYRLYTLLYYAGIRNDTGALNKSPSVMVPPLYKAVLGQETNLPVVIKDPDGDVFKCREARFVEKGHLATFSDAAIGSDCSVTVKVNNAQFGDVRVINFIVDELTLAHISIGGKVLPGSLHPISQLQVLFLVQIVASPNFPEFMFPTNCATAVVNRVNVVSGATVRLPVYARASNSSPGDTRIDRFTFRMEPDDISVPAVVSARAGNGSVSWGELEWRVHVSKDTIFSLFVTAVDTNGQDNVCLYRIQATLPELSSDLQTNVTSGPTLLLPERISCELRSMCVFPVYARGDDRRLTIFDAPLGGSDKLSFNVTSQIVGQVFLNGKSVLQSDVMVESSRTGHVQVCFVAVDWHGSVTSQCTNLTISEPEHTHPCIANLTLCGQHGRCAPNPQHLSDFLCHCPIGYIGRWCETFLNPCEFNYCGNNTKMCLFEPSISLMPVCVCKQNFTGSLCNESVFCYPNPCAPHGSCTADQVSGSHVCACVERYTGENCSRRLSPLTLDISVTEANSTMFNHHDNASKINCTMSSRLDWLDLPDSDAVAVVALTLTLQGATGQAKSVWSLSAFTSTPSLAGSDLTLARSANVEGEISNAGPASLLITWPNESREHTGTYECTVSVIDFLGKPFQFSEKAELLLS
ncbi:hypothetical protein EGW08_008314 [Elysia chlorotica]|uniref:EGF-like domain-containing protein n=1 Tax=Elysia chlorotica TaxID=188477 RepID=A0A433TQV7_ELYCH|nr:hypothetical protein EGW08_008314 [Elysia chlorotica]